MFHSPQQKTSIVPVQSQAIIKTASAQLRLSISNGSFLSYVKTIKEQFNSKHQEQNFTSNNEQSILRVRARIEGGPMGVWSPQDRDFRKIGHFRNFAKQPIQSYFYDFFRHFMHSYAFSCNKIFNLNKKRRFFYKIILKLFKVFGANGAKNGSFQPIFPIFRALAPIHG